MGQVKAEVRVIDPHNLSDGDERILAKILREQSQTYSRQHRDNFTIASSSFFHDLPTGAAARCDFNYGDNHKLSRDGNYHLDDIAFKLTHSLVLSDPETERYEVQEHRKSHDSIVSVGAGTSGKVNNSSTSLFLGSDDRIRMRVEDRVVKKVSFVDSYRQRISFGDICRLYLQFFKEAEFTRLIHPSTSRVVARYFSKDPGNKLSLYFYMPNFGIDLAKYFNQSSIADISEDDLITIIQNTFAELARIHALGIVHGDIKPQNILINPQTLVVRIIDFGCAKIIGSERPLGGGTPNYWSPEIIERRSTTEKSDVYAMMLVMVEMLTGHHYQPRIEKILQVMRVRYTPTEIEATKRRYSSAEIQEFYKGFSPALCDKLIAFVYDKTMYAANQVERPTAQECADKLIKAISAQPIAAIAQNSGALAMLDVTLIDSGLEKYLEELTPDIEYGISGANDIMHENLYEDTRNIRAGIELLQSDDLKPILTNAQHILLNACSEAAGFIINFTDTPSGGAAFDSTDKLASVRGAFAELQAQCQEKLQPTVKSARDSILAPQRPDSFTEPTTAAQCEALYHS